MSSPSSSIMEFFKFEHLPAKLQEVSKPFGELAAQVNAVETRHHAEKATALRKLLEAKDAAVRCMLPVLLAVLALGALFFPSLAQAQEVAQPPAAQSPILTAVLQYVVAPLIGVIAPLIVVALGQLVAFLRSKSSESKVASITAVFAEAARSTVAELEVTLVPQVKAALADGVLTPEEGAKIKQAALDTLKTKLPPSLLASASGLFGPFLDTWLKGLIERSVSAQKPVTTLEEAAAVLRGPQPA